MLDVLDTFIGLITIFLVLSLVVTAIGEAISAYFNFRGVALFRIVQNLVGQDKAAEIFAHENVRALCSPVRLPMLNMVARRIPFIRLETASSIRCVPGRIRIRDKHFRLPSYLAPELFCETLLDTLINPPVAVDITRKKLPHSVMNIDRALSLEAGVVEPPYRAKLNSLWQEADYDPQRLQQSMVTWFDRTADRAGGWFKRRLSFHLLIVGFVIAVLLNADTLQMFHSLSNNPELRQQMVDTAKSLDTAKIKLEEGGKLSGAICNDTSDEPICTQEELAQRLFPSLLPVLGWEESKLPTEKLCWCPWTDSCQVDDSFIPWLLKLLGFLLTAAAVSLGAPFWFDLLHKIIQVRGKIATSTTSAKSGGASPPASPGVIEAPAKKMSLRKSAVDLDRLQSIDSFNAKSFGYSLTNLFWSARLSKLAYEEKDIAQAQLQQLGAAGEIINHSGTDTQCLLVMTPGALLMSFRGTEQTPQDWLTDAHVSLIHPQQLYPNQDNQDGCLVHSGFYQALFCEKLSKTPCTVDDTANSAWNLVERYLQDNEIKARNIPVWVSGHSLGGALATLAALKLMERGYSVAAIHTFGQPRVGNQALADKIDELFGHKYYRAINHADIVPRVPFPKTPDLLNKLAFQEYAHAGRVIYFNDLAQAIMDPPIWYRSIDALQLDLKFIEEAMRVKDSAQGQRMKQAEKDWKKMAKATKAKISDMVGDHGMDNYLNLHRALLVADSADTGSGGA